MTYDDRIAGHYATGAILDRIKAGLAEAGVDPARPAPDDLKPVDEFHTGGLEATEALLGRLGISGGHKVIDLGAGIGGTARYIAHHAGAHVTGVDLTEDFVATATALSEMCGLAHLCTFRVGSVLDLPEPDGHYDLATMMHVGMNVADKERLFAEAARVLKPGGRFALYDIMIAGPGDIAYPAPWSSTAETSFVEPPEVYREAAAAAGLILESERDRTDYAVDFFRRVVAATEANGLPPLGLHLIMGPEAMERYGNAVRAAFDGVTGPWEMVFRKPN